MKLNLWESICEDNDLRREYDLMRTVIEAADQHCRRWDYARGHPGFPFNPETTGDVHPVDPRWRPAKELGLVEALEAWRQRP